MAEFPSKIMLLLEELDEDSSCVVILNNVAGLSPEEKASLRSMLEGQNKQLIDILLQFKSHKKPDILLSSLKTFFNSTQNTSKITFISADLNTLSFKPINKDKDLSIPFNNKESNNINLSGQHISSTKSATDTKLLPDFIDISDKKNKSASDTTLFNIPQVIINKNEDCIIKENSELIKSEITIQENDPKANCKSPSQLLNCMQKRELRLMKTDEKFQQILKESKEYIQVRAFSPTSIKENKPISPSLPESHCSPKQDSPIMMPQIKEKLTITPIKKELHKENQEIYKTPCITHAALQGKNETKLLSVKAGRINLGEIKDFDNNTNKQNNESFFSKKEEAESFAGMPGDLYLPEFVDSKAQEIPEIGAAEENVNNELTSTVQTEELFKKYVTEMKKEEAKNKNGILATSFNTLLRYIDCDLLFTSLISAADMHTKQITKARFVDVISNLVAAKLGQLPEASGISDLYDKLNEDCKESLKIGDILGGLSTLCSRNYANNNKLPSAIKYIAGRNGIYISYRDLQVFLESVFKIIVTAAPSSIKGANTSAKELSQLTAKQFFEEKKCKERDIVKTVEFINWFENKRTLLSPSTNFIESEQKCEEITGNSFNYANYPCPVYIPIVPMPYEQKLGYNQGFLPQMMYPNWQQPQMLGNQIPHYGLSPQYMYQYQYQYQNLNNYNNPSSNNQQEEIELNTSFPKSRNSISKAITVVDIKSKDNNTKYRHTRLISNISNK